MVDFVLAGKGLTSNDYSEADFLDAYLVYYFTTNVAKVQLALLDLGRQGRLQGSLRLLDVGVGTSTTLVARLDFLVGQCL